MLKGLTPRLRVRDLVTKKLFHDPSFPRFGGKLTLKHRRYVIPESLKIQIRVITRLYTPCQIKPNDHVFVETPKLTLDVIFTGLSTHADRLYLDDFHIVYGYGDIQIKYITAGL
ncbi:MAG: hypothetical protein QGG48_05260 [Desulfatiglandales bacterium]|jgi:hypothetical protein|nr:hypothetical protein [Desulfatiglandales bacterium]